MEVVVAYFKVMCRYLPVQNDANHERPVRVVRLFSVHLSLLLLSLLLFVTTTTTVTTLHNIFTSKGCSFFLTININFF
jgi:hypothetical protein